MDNKYIMAEEIDFEINNFGDFVYIGNNEGIEYIDITDFIKKLNLNHINSMFVFLNDLTNAKGVKLCENDLLEFQLCFSNMKAESLDLSCFDTSNAKSLYSMFSYSSLKNLDLNLNCINVVTFHEMFYGSEIEILNINLENSKATNFNDMFANVKLEKLNLNVDIKEPIKIHRMFRQSTIIELDLSNVVFSNNVELLQMFNNFNSELLILPNSFPLFFDYTTFLSSNIKVIKTPNKGFYKKHKKWFKEIGTELILIP